jgi:thiol-disulfide isomerase/thioredoxin
MKRGGSRLNANFMKKLKTEEVVICVLLVILVVLVVYYIYQNQSNEGFTNHNDAKHKLYFFYTDWCGYSQKAQPVIDDLQEVVDKYNTEIVRVDCEQEKAKAKEFGVNAYPTIVFVSSKDVRSNYDKNVKLELLEKWLSSVAK